MNKGHERVITGVLGMTVAMYAIGKSSWKN